MVEAGIKASITRKKNKLKREKNNYDKPKKNSLRKSMISKIVSFGFKTILTLESPQWLFAKELPFHKIYVFEKDEKQHSLMEKNTPDNVVLFHDDVCNAMKYVESGEIPNEIDLIYLDYKAQFGTIKHHFKKLEGMLKLSKYFGFTVCTRGQKKNKNHYIISFNKFIQQTLSFSTVIDDGVAYCDSTSMYSQFYFNKKFYDFFKNEKGFDPIKFNELYMEKTPISEMNLPDFVGKFIKNADMKLYNRLIKIYDETVKETTPKKSIKVKELDFLEGSCCYYCEKELKPNDYVEFEYMKYPKNEDLNGYAKVYHYNCLEVKK